MFALAIGLGIFSVLVTFGAANVVIGGNQLHMPAVKHDK